MAKRRGISISLAAKCQLLFGLAVLVIIAGALAVPWQRMEQLAKQPNIKAARFAADLLFREIHSNGAGKKLPETMPATAAATEAATTEATTLATETATQPTPDIPTIRDAKFPRPRILLAASATGGFAEGRKPDGVAVAALQQFREKPQESEYGTIDTLTTAGEPLRLYRYAAAVRVEASCLNCHEQYSSWIPGGAAIAATQRAMTGPLGGGGGTAPDTTGAGMAWPAVAVIRVDVPYQRDENQLLLNRIVIVVAGMVGGALAIVVFYLITSRLILQPVRVLKNTAEKISNGDLNIRSAISTGDEFQHLSETFNTMLATLQGARDQLQATNRSLDTRVGELAQSNVDLYEANRVKSEFLTNVTHELRTPLNAIIGFADLMAETATRGGDAKQQRYSENIRTSAKQLLDLINDLLDLAKIEAGKLVLREEKVNVADMCETMVNFMRPLAQKKDIHLELSIDPDMPLITTDPGRFQQILYNFLSNAIKFTPSEGRVNIDARRELPVNASGAPQIPLEEQLIRVAISDSGPGIAPDDQKVIFEKFRQIDGSVTRQHTGTGLGLAISRELANMLGARIELASVLGRGSTFTLIIPVMIERHEDDSRRMAAPI